MKSFTATGPLALVAGAAGHGAMVLPAPRAAHNQTLPGLDAVNTTRRTLLLPAGLLQPAATYVFAFTAYVVR